MKFSDMKASTAQNMASSLIINDLHLDPSTREVVRGGSTIKGITDKSFQLMWLLARAAPNSISRKDLMQGIWGEIAVSDDTLTQRVKIIRKALGKRPDGRDYIQAVHGSGYRLAGDSTINVSKRNISDKMISRMFIGVLLLGLFYIILSEAGVLHLIHKWINQPS